MSKSDEERMEGKKRHHSGRLHMAFKETTETGLSQIRKEMLREISCNITRTMKGPTLRGNQLLDMHPSILSVER